MIQMDVFNTFIELLCQTGNVTKGQTDMNELRQVDVNVSPLAEFMCNLTIKKFPLNLNSKFVFCHFMFFFPPLFKNVVCKILKNEMPRVGDCSLSPIGQGKNRISIPDDYSA